MPDLFQGDFYIQVQNAANPVLGQNGQGVCGVVLHFSHEYVGDLLVTLTSPSGQTVTLTGPTGLFGETDGTTWDITFIPCGESADPDPGFNPVWNNNQNWGLFGGYNGSYYPFDGCLEDLDSGPVNGQWTLSVTDELPNDVGNFFGYEILFCDPAGIECVSCEANAGNLLQADVVACAGDTTLDLDLTPTYSPPQQAPDPDLYDYMYLLGSGGFLLDYLDTPDLRQLAPGLYTVCGLSYLAADSSDLPAPNGILTLAQLSAQLNSPTPPFCGKITSNCVNISIQPPLPNLQDTLTLCAPECASYYDSTFCQSGVYTLEITDNGCSYSATLYLDILEPDTVVILDTICSGTCSLVPGFEQACSGGEFFRSLTGTNGCDSTVVLNLHVIEVEAGIAPPPFLTCVLPEIELTADSNATADPDNSYHWFAGNGGHIIGPSDQMNIRVDSAGVYFLEVCQSAGITCCDTAAVTVVSQQQPPAPPTGIDGPEIICPGVVYTWSVIGGGNADYYSWELPTGAVLVSGQDSSIVEVLWSLNSADTICVQAINACEVSIPVCLEITPAVIPDTPAPISGEPVHCLGDTIVYSTGNVEPGAATIWNVPPGMNIIAGQGTDSIYVVWDSVASGNLCVCILNDCGTSDTACLTVSGIDTPNAPELTGADTVCPAAVSSYFIIVPPDADKVVWEVSGGEILSGNDSSSIAVMWGQANPPAGASVCVQILNPCGFSQATCMEISITDPPDIYAGADTVVCGTSHQLFVQNGGPAGSGVWEQISGSGQVAFSDNTAPGSTLTVTASGLYGLRWTQIDQGCVVSDSLSIRFTAEPEVGAVEYICGPAGEFYNVKFSIHGGMAPYQVDGLALQGSDFISGLIPSGTDYQFVISDAFGCTAIVTGNVFCPCTSAAGVMEAYTLTACADQTLIAKHLGGEILDGNDTYTYALHTGPEDTLGQILAFSGIGAFTLLPGMVPDSVYYISYLVGNNLNGLPDLSDPCLAVSIAQPVIFRSYPVPNAGADTALCGLSLNLSASPANGIWTLAPGQPSSGFPIISDPQDPAALFQADVAGDYKLYWTITEQGCTASDTMSVLFREDPKIISVEEICDPLNEHYRIRIQIDGGSPPYQVNGMDVSGNLFESPWYPDGTYYALQVTDAGGCTSDSLSGTHLCGCGTAAGTMPDSLITVCIGNEVQVLGNGDAVLDANDIMGFVLHDSQGPGLGQIYQQNIEGFFSFQSGMEYGKVYYVSVVVGNPSDNFPDPADPCYAWSAGQPVVFHQPLEPETADNLETCGLSVDLVVSNTGNTGAWNLVNGPGMATFNFTDSITTNLIVTLPGDYILAWKESDGYCIGTDTTDVQFFEPPVINGLKTVCTGTNASYFVQFDVVGGLPPYVVDGLNGLLNGPAFLSAVLPSGSAFAVSVTDANNCSSNAIAGSHVCACLTNAGSMDTVPLILCADAPAVAVWNNDAFLDQDDKLVFILHDSPGNTTGNVLAVNDQPVFAMGQGMQTGLTYYISAVAASDTGGNIDWDDPCLSVSFGTPVLWKPLPAASLSGDTLVCAGQPAQLKVEVNGNTAVIVEFEDSFGQTFSQQITGQSTLGIDVTPTESTSYYLIGITEMSMPACMAVLSDTATIMVEEKPSAGYSPGPALICQGDTVEIDLNFHLNQAQSGGIWTPAAVTSIPANALDSMSGILHIEGLQVGTYNMLYTVSGTAVCPADSMEVQVVIQARPLADAGPDIQLDCFDPVQWLGGPLTTAEPGTGYAWSAADQTGLLGVAPTLEVATPGVYTLRVSGVNGCVADDSAEVTQLSIPIQVKDVHFSHVRCYGESNGRIRVDSVTGGTPPYLFALNGGSLSHNNSFPLLDAGTYTIVIQDVTGCEWLDTIIIQEPPELKIDLGDDVQAALGDSVYLWLQSSLQTGLLDTIIWVPLLDSMAAGHPYQKIFPAHTIRVVAEVADSNGCTATDDVLITIDKTRKVYIPNVIAPESLVNDRFAISLGTDVTEVVRFEIFDRWGAQVYTASHILPDDATLWWDGRIKGKKAAAGVYGYVIEVLFKDGERNVYFGDVVLYH